MIILSTVIPFLSSVGLAVNFQLEKAQYFTTQIVLYNYNHVIKYILNICKVLFSFAIMST